MISGRDSLTDLTGGSGRSSGGSIILTDVMWVGIMKRAVQVWKDSYCLRAFGDITPYYLTNLRSPWISDRFMLSERIQQLEKQQHKLRQKILPPN